MISARAAKQTMLMMELVTDVDDGVAPGAAIPGYRVAGKTGTAQRAGKNGRYDDTFTVSFAGFAPADEPAVHRLRARAEPPQRRRRRLDRRSGVQQDHELPPSSLRGAADRHQAVDVPGRVLTCRTDNLGPWRARSGRGRAADRWEQT